MIGIEYLRGFIVKNLFIFLNFKATRKESIMLILYQILISSQMVSTVYNSPDRRIFDFRILLSVVRFFISNIILLIIFLFLTLEEIDWSIMSFTKSIKDKVVDNTSWNLNNLLVSLIKI